MFIRTLPFRTVDFQGMAKALIQIFQHRIQELHSRQTPMKEKRCWLPLMLRGAAWMLIQHKNFFLGKTIMNIEIFEDDDTYSGGGGGICMLLSIDDSSTD